MIHLVILSHLRKICLEKRQKTRFFTIIKPGSPSPSSTQRKLSPQLFLTHSLSSPYVPYVWQKKVFLQADRGVGAAMQF